MPPILTNEGPARIALLIGTTSALLLAVALSAQQAKPAAPMQIEKVKDGLYLIRGPFNRCAPNGCGGAYGDDGLLHEAGDVAVRVTSEGLILVDNKYQDNVAEILEKVRSVSTLPVKYVLNTHHHTDHAGGDATFITTTEIIAHRNVRENFLRNKQPGAPRVTFTDQASVFLGGAEVRAYYFGRGHTNGDAVIHFPDLRVIHTGDLITEGMPVLDYRNGASAVEWVSVLDKILALDFDVAIPGHGPLLTKERIRSDRQKLVTMNQRMADLARRNVPLDQVFGQLRLEDLGWDHTVSTVAFRGGLSGYYEEMKSQPPVFAADPLSGTWTTGGPAPQTFVFKASGDRFGGIACGPCDRAASVFRVEDGRILDANHVAFFVSYDTDGPRFKEFGRYRDRVVGSLADGQLSLSAQPEGRNVPVSTLRLKRVVEGFVPDTTNVPPSSLLAADPAAASSPIEGRWVFAGRAAQQNVILKVRGQKIWGVICGPCDPDGVTLIDDGTVDGTTLRFYINHIDTPPSPTQRGVRRNIMTGTLSGNVMRFTWVREGAETEPGGEIVMFGPIRE